MTLSDLNPEPAGRLKRGGIEPLRGVGRHMHPRAQGTRRWLTASIADWA